MPKKPKNPTINPTDVIGSIFTARRDLLHTSKWCIQGSGFTMEEADLLVSLYGVRRLKWDDLKHDDDAYVPYAELERYLVHNPNLLSRRIRKLAALNPPLVEVANVAPGSGLHFNSKRARITSEGMKRTEPIWKRFEKVSIALLEGVTDQERWAHHSVNQKISARIRGRRDGLASLFEGDGM